MVNSKAKTILQVGWLVVAILTVVLTACPAIGIFPLRELPWSGLGVLLTWVLAAFDMPPTILLIPGILGGLYSDVPHLILSLLGSVLTITPTIVLARSTVWNSISGRRVFLIYTFGYALLLVGGGIYTALQWNSIVD